MLRASSRRLARRTLLGLSLRLSLSTTTTTTTTNHKNKPPPFDKILIANRGEISQRIARTCQALGTDTVAIYSVADAKAPFVQAATQAVCLGPAATADSYLHVPKVLQALQATQAQAVHPGYGFLSENADFAQRITDQGIVWLGPPPSAIRDMGDKLRSKEIAQAAGVNIIPGYDGTIESLDQALQVSNEIGYPVLLKAAAGGGGKGMRTCYNDQEIKEAYRTTKSEAKKFFADDRLLVEKYIENPHQIEFQVMCEGNGGKVVVFPERECSIQRRNQKIIEESPSCLLTEETRRKMVEQTKQLCLQVGYASAGTLEWLVDEHQNFYFLEMNTRLQVEHPVTEAVSGVDLVKAMLWVGAGWGLPPELQIEGDLFPAKGHAVEARIYAEDPLRGYLPSTGPLVKYQEPVFQDEDSYLRMDSGVIEGHVVSPFYDPMLSKIIAYAPTRDKAIDVLAKGLDEYVIEGVQHNARLCNAVLRHAAFRAGNTPTSFLPSHIPEFHGVQLSASDAEELAVAAVAVGLLRNDQLARPPLVGSSSSNEPVVLRLGGMFGDAYQVRMMEDDGTIATVQKLGESEAPTRTIAVNALEYALGDYVARVTLDGVERAIQVLQEDECGEMKVQMYGADIVCLIQSLREFELSKFMHPPKIVDTSDVVMSPMPGTLISFSVSEGDHVEIGQELCIVEAMKMQNIVRSPREGIIGKVKVKEGEALVTDEIIMEFAEEEEANAA